MKDKKVALHKLSEDVVAADGANIQENIKRLFVIMQDLEVIPPPSLVHVSRDSHVFSSA